MLYFCQTTPPQRLHSEMTGERGSHTALVLATLKHSRTFAVRYESACSDSASPTKYPGVPSPDLSRPQHFKSGLSVRPCEHGLCCLETSPRVSAPTPFADAIFSMDTRKLITLNKIDFVPLQGALLGHQDARGDARLCIIAMERLTWKSRCELALPTIVGATVQEACARGWLTDNWAQHCMIAKSGHQPATPAVRTALFAFHYAFYAFGDNCGVLFNSTHRLGVPSPSAHARATQRRLRAFRTIGLAACLYCFEGQSHFIYSTAAEVAILAQHLPEGAPILIPLQSHLLKFVALMRPEVRARLLPLEPDVLYYADQWLQVLRNQPHGAEAPALLSLAHTLFVPFDPPQERIIVVIDRNDRTVRRLGNHAQLVAALKLSFNTFSVREFTGSKMPLEDARSLFSRACAVIGPHGGAFMNMVRQQPGRFSLRVVRVPFTTRYVLPS